MWRSAPILFLSLATPVAGEISFGQPLNCTLGQDCYIQNYVDLDPSPAAKDFTCGPLSYDGHKGTDFGLSSDNAMILGVDVLAAADGVVTGVRDSMPDIRSNAENAPDLQGKDCGNGVVLSHGDGWETQYCHMKLGSITVKTGQSVSKGTTLGQVGLSGRTEFPHLHLSVRKDGAVVPPFAPQAQACGAAPADTLWSDPITYVPVGLISIGFSDRLPDFAEVQSGTADTPQLPATSPALVLWALGFGTGRTDELRFEISGPDGPFHRATADFEKPQAQAFRATGRRISAPLTAGLYTGTVTLLRHGVDVETRHIAVTVE